MKVVKMNDKEARNAIDKWVNTAEEALKEAEKISDAYNIGFSWDYVYGMGGYYTPKKLPEVITKNDILDSIKDGTFYTKYSHLDGGSVALLLSDHLSEIEGTSSYTENSGWSSSNC